MSFRKPHVADAIAQLRGQSHKVAEHHRDVSAFAGYFRGWRDWGRHCHGGRDRRRPCKRTRRWRKGRS